MNVIKDAWSKESFEDTVAAALITCFEARIKKTKGAGPNTLNEERAMLIRKAGPYIPGNDREILFNDEGTTQPFDIDNDPLPLAGCWAHSTSHLPPVDGQYSGWFRSIFVRQRDRLDNGWRRRDGGALYELVYMTSQNEFVEGERFFFSVTKEGRVVACEAVVRGDVGGFQSRHMEFRTEPEQLAQIELAASATLQYLADQRYCWVIEAREQNAFVRLGCQEEEIKSLMYARTLPLTETGRKRPIMHLVESHKRRMRNGTEIDVQAGLRGVQTVEIGGTTFTVRPPAVVLPLLARPSRERAASKIIL